MKQITGSSPAPRIVRPQLATPPAIERDPAPEPAAELVALEAFEDEAFDTDAFDLEADEPNTVSPEPENADYHHPVAEAEPQLEEPAGEPELVLGLSPQVATGFAGDIQL